MAKRIRTLLDAGVPPEGIIENSRVLGLAVSPVAASATALVGEAMLKPGDTELEAAHRYIDATRTLRARLHRDFVLHFLVRRAIDAAAAQEREHLEAQL